jgi:putative endonuclease
MDKHYTYIIESESSGKWYYGYTTNLIKRLAFHNDGLNTSTRNRGPWKYIFIREFGTKAEALAFEISLKKTRNKEYVGRAYSDYFLRDNQI